MLRLFRYMVLLVVTPVVLSSCTTENDSGTGLSRPQISSAAELDAYLKTTSNSPLDHLSPAAKQRFLTSLVFGNNGLGSFRYTDLKSLPASDVYDILHLFGNEEATAIIKPAATGGSGIDAHPDRINECVIQESACKQTATCSSAIDNMCNICNC